MAVYCTLVINARYLPGAIVVAYQLRRLDPAHDVVCLASAALPADVKAELGRYFKTVHMVDIIDAGPSPQLSLLNRPELRLATTKLHLWTLPYDHVVYVDADTLPVHGPLELLFEPLQEGSVAAAPDTGWPDIFNSGVLGLRPSAATFDRLLSALTRHASFDGSDQGLLNETLHWVRVPFVYNVTVSSSYQYRPAYLRFKDDVRIIHYVGNEKPWDAPGGDGAQTEVRQWWHAYRTAVAAPLSGDTTVLGYELALGAEADSRPYNPNNIIHAPLDHWDATQHAPLRGSKPEAERLDWKAVQNLKIADNEPAEPVVDDAGPVSHVHVFPEFGPALAHLPFEENQAPPERIF